MRECYLAFAYKIEDYHWDSEFPTPITYLSFTRASVTNSNSVIPVIHRLFLLIFIAASFETNGWGSLGPINEGCQTNQ